MSKKNMLAFSSLCLLLGAVPASGASLLTNGDFESAEAFESTPDNFTISAQLNEWHVNGTQYTRVPTGASGAADDDYAKHNVAAGGQDQRLVQFIAAGGLLSGDKLTLEFDYIYESSPNAGSNPQARVSLIGIAADRNYNLFGGSGTDGKGGGGEFEVVSPDALLGQLTLAFTGTGAWALDQTLAITLSSSYAYIGVIFQAGCFDSTTASDCNHLRGLDNVSLTTVPEPRTLALLGLGLAGLGAMRRKKLAA